MKEETRNKTFSLRLTDAEFNYIKQQARAQYMSIGAYVRYNTLSAQKAAEDASNALDDKQEG